MADTKIITGLDDLIEQFKTAPAKLRKKVLLAALRKAARVVSKAAKDATPVIRANDPMVRKGWRTRGLVRRKISVRRSKAAQQAGDVGVFVNVKPAAGAKYRTKTTKVVGLKIRATTQVKASQRGAKSPLDPYYWRFVNDGTHGKPGAKFLQAGGKVLQKAFDVFKAEIGPAFDKLNRRQAP